MFSRIHWAHPTVIRALRTSRNCQAVSAPPPSVAIQQLASTRRATEPAIESPGEEFTTSESNVGVVNRPPRRIEPRGCPRIAPKRQPLRCRTRPLLSRRQTRVARRRKPNGIYLKLGRLVWWPKSQQDFDQAKSKLSHLLRDRLQKITYGKSVEAHPKLATMLEFESKVRNTR